MPVFDIFSKRKRRSKEANEPDVYQYDEVPNSLRTQIRFIWDDAIGRYYRPAPYGETPRNNNSAWKFIRDSVCREKGVQSLAGREDPKEDCVHYLLEGEPIDEWLDLVEFAFRYIDRVLKGLSDYDMKTKTVTQRADDAIDEFNFRLREAGIGYQYENGQIIRIDSYLVHSEIVRPALVFLSDRRFSGPQDEFLSAHAHYRAGEFKDAITNALNSLESTMKVICDIKGWSYEKGARASDLVKIIRANALLPEYLDTSFDQLVGTLKSGLPKVRNEEGAHGQGGIPREAPHYIAAYALHLAAAKVLLLSEALKASE